ncbi:homeobox-DDT domain protein RLT3 isoform X3 [Prunus yedoensis var. nudiflora]|uniref:Homeobox-DDT domain protein RLT3 isoform X3 n=1 Tax=Prunus yedoensis var. nudiflora TaxID=2094558 RepID=A0A314Y4S4_PRUYE|nr:homeobox-DDT domain protein RLT3 isoform X3 [Prunus yedoensis var. nudiflora]
MKYGLRPGTLKGELFRVLLEQGIHGLKVSVLAKSLRISEWKLSNGMEDLESLIGSTLSMEESQSDTEDSGAVDDDIDDSGTCSSDDNSGCNSGNSKIKNLTYMNHGKSKDNMVIAYTEIDESHSGEVWLLGLMEGEYSDLSIEEKLSSIVALIDLLHAGYLCMDIETFSLFLFFPLL